MKRALPNKQHFLPTSRGKQFASLLALAMATPCLGVDYLVSTEQDEPYNGGSLMDETVDGVGLSLREAIGLANSASGDDDGDTIAMDGLVFLLGAPTLNLGSELVITDDVEINGGVLLASSTLDGGNATRLIRLDTGSAPGSSGAVSISNFDLTNGASATTGGGIQLGSADSLTLDNVSISSCSAVDGGAIHNDGGMLVATDTDFVENVANGASGSGGGIFNAAGGKVSLTGGSFDSNLANRAGGGIEDQSGGTSGFDLMLTNVDFTDNNAGVAPATAAPGNGGAIHITGSGSIRIEGGTATGNLAGREGGAFWNGAGLMEIVDATITMNTASGAGADDGGGGLFNNGGTMTVSGGSVSNNTADGASGSGGGLLTLDGMVTLTNTTFATNSANRAGGAIEAIDGTLTLTDVTLGGTTPAEGNIAGPMATAAPGNGGGIHISGTATTVVDGGLVGFNVAASEGGGLWNQVGAMMIVRGGAVISDNAALGTAADNGGGGLFNNGGTFEINATGGAVQVLRNQAIVGLGSGGGLLNTPGGTVDIRGAVFSENVATRAGGAIEDVSGVPDGIKLTDTTLSGNLAGLGAAAANPGNGGGIHVSGSGGVTISGGSITGNLAASEGGGLWNGTGLMTVSGAQITSNVASGASADNGGGGIFNNGGSVVVNSLTMIDGNIADGASGSGGGIFNEIGGTLTVTDSTISNNRANRAGGGIEDNSGAGLGITLTGTTLSGNNAGLAPAVAAPGNGGAIHITGAGDTMISGGSVSGNSAALEGGGLWNGSGTMTVSGVMISGNTATGDALDDGGGGIFNNGGTLVVESGSALSMNTATGASGSGGGILNVSGGTVSVSDSSLSSNTAVRAGGGIEDQSGLAGTAITLMAVDFTGNMTGSAPGNGGALHVTGTGGVSYTGGTVADNTAAAEGGGLWNGTGTMMVDGVMFENNTASGAAPDNGGGALFNAGGTLMVSNCMITSNVADGASGSGGGIFNDASGSLTVTDSTIAMNTANRAGGALEVTADTISTLTGCTVSGNTAGPAGTAAPGNGGAIHISSSGSVETSFSTYDGNDAANEGGGLWNSGAGTMTISSCAIVGNDSPDGGGLFNQAGSGMTTVTNTTLSGNTATNGGGIRVEGGTMDLVHVTLASNTASANGGGIEDIGGMVTVASSIIADNAAPSSADASVTFVSAMATLLEDASGAAGIADGVDGSLVGVDPMLVALADNGGPTMTHRPLSASPVIDAADASGLANDQRGMGFPRTLGTAPDMGALETAYLGYADWADENFTAATPVGDRGPDDDADGDGVENVIEWLTGMNPEQANGNPFMVSTDGGDTSISFPRSKTVPSGADALESSTDLLMWTPRPMSDLMRESLDADTERITLTVPNGDEPRFFLRLDVNP